MQNVQIETLRHGGETIAVVTGKNAVVDAQSALKLAMRVRYETGAEKIAFQRRFNAPAPNALRAGALPGQSHGGSGAVSAVAGAYSRAEA